jgi:steroid delta-isomerase-like uncharacterized protein
MTPEEHKAKVRQVIDEAYGKGNLDALDEVNAPDAVWHQRPGPDIKGMDAYKQMVTNLRNALSDFKFTVDEYIAEGDINAMRWTIQGTHSGQLMNLPVPPTGKQVTMNGILMTRLVNGKAVEHWNYSDMLGFMQQLGVAPPTGKAGG